MVKISTTLGLIVLASFHTYAQFVVPTADLIEERYDHESQVLDNGNVLVFGGSDGELFNPQSMSACEIYDITTNSWSATGSMNEVRYGFASVKLDNGNILAISGFTSTCEIYDVATGTWSYTGSLTSYPEFHYNALVLDDGRVMMSDGIVTELYDQSLGTWIISDSLNDPRGLGTMVKLTSGKILYTGGGGGSGTGNKNPEIFDPVSETWSFTADTMSSGRTYSNSILMANGKVLIAGGSGLKTAEVYDPANDTFTPTANTMNFDRSSCKMMNLINGEVLIYGWPNTGDSLHSAIIYNPSSNSWSFPSNFTPVRGVIDYSMDRLSNGKILIAAGFYLGFNASKMAFLIDENDIPTTVLNNNEIHSQLLVYPNPMEATTTVAFNNGDAQWISLTIYNSTGKIVKRYAKAFGDRLTLNTQDFNRGLYLLKALDNGGVISSAKLVVE